MRIIYKGDYRTVTVPEYRVDATWGEPVDVSDEIAGALLESDVWMKATKEDKKAAAAPANAAEDTTSEEKGTD